MRLDICQQLLTSLKDLVFFVARIDICGEKCIFYRNHDTHTQAMVKDRLVTNSGCENDRFAHKVKVGGISGVWGAFYTGLMVVL